MTEQEENELICERLLGWKRHVDRDMDSVYYVDANEAYMAGCAPMFDDWESAGRILEALQKVGAAARDILRQIGIMLTQGLLRPEDIRAAALEYIRQVKL